MTTHIEEIASAWKGHRDFAHWLVQRLQPQITVELGVDYGYSTFVLATNNPGQVYGIDLFMGDAHSGAKDADEQYQQVMDFKLAHGFDNIEIIRNDFNTVAAGWDKKIDILHIDGLHTYDAVSNDFRTWAPHVRDGGVIIMHDVTAFADVARFFQDDIVLPRLFFSHSAGLGVVSADQALLIEIEKTFAGVQVVQ